MYYVGIDIGSTAAKIAVMGARELLFAMPTGWSSYETVERIQRRFAEENIPQEEITAVATGYGRGAVKIDAVKRLVDIYQEIIPDWQNVTDYGHPAIHVFHRNGEPSYGERQHAQQ